MHAIEMQCLFFGGWEALSGVETAARLGGLNSGLTVTLVNVRNKGSMPTTGLMGLWRSSMASSFEEVRCMGREEDAISLGWALCIRMRRCSKCGPKIDDDVAELMNQLEWNEYVSNAGPRKGEARPTLLI
jgi:hypothetical protein